MTFTPQIKMSTVNERRYLLSKTVRSSVNNYNSGMTLLTTRFDDSSSSYIVPYRNREMKQ